MHKERAGSAVDLLIVGSAGFADPVKALYPVQARLKSEINPIAMTATELREKSRRAFPARRSGGRKAVTDRRR